jgi:trehalose-phosphatase
MTAPALPAELRGAIARLATTPRLLVACDYDGVLSPIVPKPEDAVPLRPAVDALRSIAGLDHTTAAVISGRARRDLAALSGLAGEVHLVGSHGSEFEAGFVQELDDAATALHRRLDAELTRIVGDAAGVQLEVKPASIAVHTRRAAPDVARRVTEQVRSGPCTWDGVQVTEGKAVVELAVVRTDKGQALDILRHQTDATAAMFVGDDVTDEKAFARLTGQDLGVKVGDGETLADHRIPDPPAVTTLLTLLHDERRTWLAG